MTTGPAVNPADPAFDAAFNAAFNALADPVRREILTMLARRPGCSAGELAQQVHRVGRTAVSSHLRVLRTAGLIAERRTGRYRYYSLDPRGPAVDVIETLQDIFQSPPAVCTHADRVRPGATPLPRRDIITSASPGLETYLNDHLAGSAAGAELARKIAAENADTPMGPALAELATEIEQDATTLADLMERLGIERSAVKQAAGWMVEKLSRLKLSDVLTGDDDLRRLLEFETLSLGVEGKRLLWRALVNVTGSHPELAATDLPGLVERAEAQRAVLEDLRLEVGRRALSG